SPASGGTSSGPSPLPHCVAREHPDGSVPVHSQPASTLQAVLQPSPPFVLPSSHCSPDCTTPSPQRGNVQSRLQPSVSTRLPSSHCSGSCRTPSPQVASSMCSRTPM